MVLLAVVLGRLELLEREQAVLEQDRRSAPRRRGTPGASSCGAAAYAAGAILAGWTARQGRGLRGRGFHVGASSRPGRLADAARTPGGLSDPASRSGLVASGCGETDAASWT